MTQIYRKFGDTNVGIALFLVKEDRTKLERMRQYVETIKDECISQVSINCVIFGFQDRKLQLVTNRMEWGGIDLTVLPGGFVKQTEDVSAAVARIVRESTGLEEMLFQQFTVVGAASRSFAEEFTRFSEVLGKEGSETWEWFAQRFISICYLALVHYEDIELKPTQFLEAAEWMPIDQITGLAMDHTDIAEQARATLAKEISHTPIESHLLPPQFTLPELHALFESILQRKIDRPNFRRKMLQSNRLQKVGQDTSNGRRPADLYELQGEGDGSLVHELKLGF